MILSSRSGNREIRARLSEAAIVGTSWRVIGSGAASRDPYGVAAYYRAVRIAAEALAGLQPTVWTGEGALRRRAGGRVAAFLARRPNPVQTSYGFRETIGESDRTRGNAYVWLIRDKDSGFPLEWWALHPDQVTVVATRSGPVYEVRCGQRWVDPPGRGRATYALSALDVLHIRGFGNGGELVAPSPVELFADTLLAARERQAAESRFYKGGMRQSVAAVFPGEVKRDQARRFADGWQADYGGTENDDKLRVIGGGATLQTIGLSMRDAQFVESIGLTVREAARIVGTPASWLEEPGSAAPLEQELSRWLRLGIGPLCQRVEGAINEHPAFGLSRPSRYVGMDTDGFVRGDLKTEADIVHQQVQSGVLLPDEARALLGYEPLPDGLGQIPQIVPVGGSAAGVPIPTPTAT